MKKLETLIEDMSEVLKGGGGWSESISHIFSLDIFNTSLARFKTRQTPRKHLSMSSLGQPCKRKIWYKINKGEVGEEPKPSDLLKFFYGDMIESFVLHLAMAAGHDVDGMQSRMEINGIKGHRDAVIDGVTVDVKTASPYSFNKFKEGNLRDEDPFGYISQLSSYVYAARDDDVVTDKKRGAFLVINKVSGEMVLDVYDLTEELAKKEEEIDLVKGVVAGPRPSKRLDPVPVSKTSENKKLCMHCTFCEYKKDCWPELRVFEYSNGPMYLVEVNTEPSVTEI